jgi:hypothetical protein
MPASTRRVVPPAPPPPAQAGTVPDWVSVVIECVKSLRFGFVQITIHDSNVVHIERTERTRLEPTRGPEKSSSLIKP